MLSSHFYKSLPSKKLRTNMHSCNADMAQLVEHHLAKVGVAGSNPVVRSIVCKGRLLWTAFFTDGDVAKW